MKKKLVMILICIMAVNATGCAAAQEFVEERLQGGKDETTDANSGNDENAAFNKEERKTQIESLLAGNAVEDVTEQVTEETGR